MIPGPILAATDLTDKSFAALRVAAVLAKESGAHLYCVHVVEGFDEHNPWLAALDDLEASRRAVQTEYHARLEEHVARELKGLIPTEQVDVRVLIGGVVDELLVLSADLAASKIVVGSLSQGPVEAFFLGSTANALLREAELPVLVVPPGQDASRFSGDKKILAPVDGSAAARASLLYAVEMARAFEGGSVILMHSMGTPAGVGDSVFPVHLGLEALARVVISRKRWLQAIVKDLEIGDVVTDTLVEQGPAASEIVEVARRENVDVICLGANGTRGLRRFLLGGTAERVLRASPCPVLAIDREDPTPLPSPADFFIQERDGASGEEA